MPAATDTTLTTRFPPPPVKGGDRLEPILSWHEMFLETQATGVDFDDFWLESVEAGLAYFFRWFGEPRSTVLVVWDEDGPTHIECRKSGSVPVSTADAEPILAEVAMQFRDAGFPQERETH